MAVLLPWDKEISASTSPTALTEANMEPFPLFS